MKVKIDYKEVFLYRNKKIIVLILILFVFLIFPFSQGYSQLSQNLDISVETIIGAPSPPPQPQAPQIFTPGGIYPLTKVIFKGRAYPDAFLTLLKNGEVAGTFFAEDSGIFEKEISGLENGRYSFSIFAEDIDGRRSPSVEFALDILKWTKTTISGISIPPTISVYPTKVERREVINIIGYGFPDSEIHIFISPGQIVKKTSVSSDGRWNYELDTSFLKEGEYVLKARALFEDGRQSECSQILSFSVVPSGAYSCWGADLNLDGRVNVVDFSILLYFWNNVEPANWCADINADRVVDVFDFSIMMYSWTD